MFLPPVNARENKNLQFTYFGGLDLRAKADANTLLSCHNLSANSYPAISPRASRNLIYSGKNITKICAPEYNADGLSSFTGVENNQFFYQGKKIGDLTDGEKSIADFNGRICIFPDKLYYSYLPDSETGEISQNLVSMENTLSLSGVKFYSSYDTLTGSYSAYINKSGAGFDSFKTGDSIVISGCSQENNNVCILSGTGDYADSNSIISAVVESATADRLNLLLFKKNGEYATFTNCTEPAEISIKISIPDMDHICVHNNRLWGTDKNGEYISASKLGDCTNFNSFQGLSDDSWYGRIGTAGEFTGICSYRSAVVAFKRECIHHIYGDSPQSFSIPKQTLGGCIDGKSIAEIGGILHYLSPTGFCCYGGGEPYSINDRLGNLNFVSCCAGTDSKRYYASVCDRSGDYSLLVYEPNFGIWHKEDNLPFISFLQYAGRLYGATPDRLYLFGSGQEDIDWSFTTQRITFSSMLHKGLNNIWLRLDIKENAHIDVEISYDGGSFSLCRSIDGSLGFGTKRVPVRLKKCDSFQLRVSGRGNATIHDLEMIYYQGGKNFGI